MEYLKMNTVTEVEVYSPSRHDLRFVALLRKLHGLLRVPPSIDSSLYTPPTMRRWFTRMFCRVAPDIVIMNYVHWDGLLKQSRSKRTVYAIDMHDLVTLNTQMRQALRKYLPKPPINADTVDSEVLDEEFFAALHLSADPKEFRIYDKYDYTISISSKEAGIVKENTRKTKTILIPMTQEPSYITNRYRGSALFPTGPNPFNTQGYLYFAKRVLPKVLHKAPSFSLQVTGTCCKYVTPVEGIVLSGFVPDLNVAYESSQFVVCPVLGGTGQQVKIVEAMAHGLPVIASRYPSEGSPIEHGVNGLVANNADEFAEYVIKLWKDRDLCTKLGQAARETIVAKFSRTQLLEGLSVLVA
jgi:hypothetical protein